MTARRVITARFEIPKKPMFLYNAGAFYARDDKGPKQEGLLVCDFHGANSALLNAWPQVSPHEPLSDEARFLILGHVYAETLFGASTGSMKGTNCWLSALADSDWMRKKGSLPGFGRFLHSDKNQLTKRVQRWFRYYPNQYEAAKDYLEFLISSAAQRKQLSALFQILKSGNSSSFAAYLLNFHCDPKLRDCYSDKAIAEYGKIISDGKQDARRCLSSSCTISNYAVPKLPPNLSRPHPPSDLDPIPPLPYPIPPIPPPGPLPVPDPILKPPILPPPIPSSPAYFLSLPKPRAKEGLLLLAGLSALLYASTDFLHEKDDDL